MADQAFSNIQPIQQTFSSVTPIQDAQPEQPQQPSFTDRLKEMGGKIYDTLPGLGQIHSLSGAVQDWATKKRDEAEVANLQTVAKGGKSVEPAGIKDKGAYYDALARVTGMVHGASSPTGVATTAATLAAPEIMGPVLMAHGAYNAAKNAPAAIQGNPEAAAASIGGLAEATGGAAATGAAVEAGGGPATQVVRNALPDRSVPTARVNATPPAGQMQPALANTPKEVLEYAGKKGIDLTPAQANQSPVSRTVEAIGERSLLGGEDLAQAKLANATKLSQNVRDIADAADPKGGGLSEEQAGETIQQTAKVAQDIKNTNASNAYKQLPQGRMNNPIDVSPIRAAYFQKLKQAEVSLANRNPQVAEQIRGALQQGSNLGTPATTVDGAPYIRPELTFKDLMKVRSDAIADGGAMARAGAPSEVQGLYRGLAEDTDTLMEAEAKKQGFLPEWREANAGWKEYKQIYDDPQSPIYQILSKRDPARVTRTLLNNGSAADIEALQKEDMQPALEALKRQAIMDIGNRGFKVTGDGLGGYSDAFLNTLFGRAATKELYLNGELARRFGFQQNPSGTSNVLMGMEQLSKDPSKWMLPMGAAKVSKPQTATNFLPQAPKTITLPPRTANLAALAGVSAGNGSSQ